jgi:hypothetical protein
MFNKEDLVYMVELANGVDYDREPTIANALELFKGIKKVEKENELNEAKCDLEMIFGVKKEDLKGLSKNQLYMLHQSNMVNAIYFMLKGAVENS